MKTDVLRETTRRILGSAIKVHREIGPGLLESTYRSCMAQQLAMDGFGVEQEVPIPISYQGLVLPTAYRADLIVDASVLLELKAVAEILPIHTAQTLTYLRHANLRVGLLINFNVPLLRQGVRRYLSPQRSFS